MVKKSTDCTDETDSRALPLRWYCERKIRVIRVICGQKNKHPEGHTQEKRCVPLRILRPLRETKFAFRERSIRIIGSIRSLNFVLQPQITRISQIFMRRVARIPPDG